MRTRTLLVAALLTLAGCDKADDGPVEVVSGTVTVNGKPAVFPMIVLRGLDGKEVTGPGKADGTYRVDNPPKGKVIVYFAAGPPIPGGPKTVGNIPDKYTSAKSDLIIGYAGGKVTHDFDLTR